MNRIIAIVAALTAVIPAICQTPAEQKADSAYSADNFAEAARLYTDIADSLGTSAPLLYNIGNCYYRLGKPGKAIVAYERALRINPTYEQAKTNLGFVNSQIADKPGARGSFMSNTLDRISTSLTSNAWAWIAFALFIATLSGIGLYLFTTPVALRKLGFFGALVLMLLTFACGVFAVRGASIASDPDFAVVTVPSTILSTSPREPKDRREEAMLLHEGTKVRILDSISAQGDTTGLKWLDVRIDNAHRAWIKSSDVERI